MKLITDCVPKIVKMGKMSHICQVKGCKSPVFAIVVFTPEETEHKNLLAYPICREHCIEGSKLGTVIWDFKEREK